MMMMMLLMMMMMLLVVVVMMILMLMIGRTSVNYITMIFMFYSSQSSSNAHQLQVTPVFPGFFAALPIHGGRQTFAHRRIRDSSAKRFQNRCVGDAAETMIP